MCMCLLSVCVCCCCDLFRDVAIGNKTHSNSIFYSNFERERQRVRERSVPANSPQRERQGKHESAIIQSTDCVCVSADFDSKQKSAENFISAPLFVMFSLQLYACVCEIASVCACVRACALLLHFGFGALKCGNSALPFRSPRSASFRRCR